MTFANTSNKDFPRTVGVTTRWGFDDGQRIDGVLEEICGPGSLAISTSQQLAQGCTYFAPREFKDPGHTVHLTPEDAKAIGKEFVEMHDTADMWIYTRYPLPLGRPPNTDLAALQEEVQSGLRLELYRMAAVSSLGEKVTRESRRRFTKPIAIQEIGYPSSHALGETLPGLPPYTNNAIAGQQRVVVTAAFEAWSDHNAMWPLTRGGVPRIGSFNWFLLTDFSAGPGVPGDVNGPGDPKPFGLCPEGFAELPTCSWGLINETGEIKPAWSEFAALSRTVNPLALGPIRECP